LVDKHGLDLSKRTTLHSRWLAWWLWGRYEKKYRFGRNGKWLEPPAEAWRIRSRIEAFEHLHSLPTSLVHGLIESFRRPWRGYEHSDW
jgi:hypothetical protein